MLGYVKDFLRKYSKAREEKDSILCAGFDPALPRQRKDKIIPKRYFKKGLTEETVILDFFEDFLEAVQDHCCAVKPNNQYVFHMSLNAYQKMNKMIHERGLVSILDQKIGDIGSTNDAGFFWMKEMGFDAVTHSPFAGNIAESLTSAHEVGLGLITLTLMSNPDAIYFMKNATIEGKKGYEFIADQIKKHQGDGIVVGTTGHVTKEDIREIRKRAGTDPVMLIPGIGTQKGNITMALKYSGKNVLLNVGRAILYSDNIKQTAKKYNEQFNEVRKQL
ncbi:MAG: hypothetical protein GF308_12710 [Candidatus Heimdallarchaeota archaeon]|nr:hypothetical protein [Candidatus Heimdallarchaeota archaeon]